MRAGALRAFASASACALLLAACGAPDPERIAREREVADAIDKAAARVYKRPFDVIWSALLASAAERRMTIVEADAVGGVIELRHGASSSSAGERIDIRVTATAEGAVRVEIRSQPLVAVSLPRDWQRVLFGDLEQKIAPRRQP